MLHPPPRLRSCWLWRWGGTAGEPPSGFHPYLNRSPDPPPGVHQCLRIFDLCLNRLRSLVAGPGRAVSWGLREETRSGDDASSGFEASPELVQALLCPESCCLLSRWPECVLLLLPLRCWGRGEEFLASPARLARAEVLQRRDSAPGPPPWLGTVTWGVSLGALAGPSWAWLPCRAFLSEVIT